jgi:hypothetical protein
MTVYAGTHTKLCRYGQHKKQNKFPYGCTTQCSWLETLLEALEGRQVRSGTSHMSRVHYPAIYFIRDETISKWQLVLWLLSDYWLICSWQISLPVFFNCYNGLVFKFIGTYALVMRLTLCLLKKGPHGYLFRG